ELPKPELPSYTAEELATLADEDGISAIRKVAEPLEVTGTSIAELIGKILVVAGPKAPIDPAVQAAADAAEAEAAALAEAEAAVAKAAADAAAKEKADAKAAKKAAAKAAKAAEAESAAQAAAAADKP